MGSDEPVVFATVKDLEDRWRNLSAGEQARARVLLEDASSLIRDLVPRWANVDKASLRRATCAMVRRAMATPLAGADGGLVSATQMSAGPYMQQFSYANPSGDLYLTKAEKKSLGVGGSSKAYEVNLITDVEWRA